MVYNAESIAWIFFAFQMSSSQIAASSSLEKVPPEIQSHIVDAIAIAAFSDSTLQPEFKDTLRACLHVSPAFRCNAKRHIFKHIRILGDSEQDIYSIILRLRALIDAPDLGILPFIRDLDLDVEFGFLCTPKCEGYRNHRLTPFVVVAIIRNLTFVLDMLRHPKAQLTTFSFRGPGDCSWSTMSPEFLRTLRNVIKSPSSVSLKLCDMQDLPKNILRGTSITHLTIIDSTVSNSTKSKHSNLPLPSLESVEADDLSLVRTLYPLNWQAKDVDRPFLKSVCLHVKEGNVQGSQILDAQCDIFVKQFLHAKYLHIVFDSYDLVQLLSTTPKVDLTQHKALKYLTLHYGSIKPPLSIEPHTKVKIGLYPAHISLILRACPDTLRHAFILLDHVYPAVEAVASDPAPWASLDSLLNLDTFPYIEGIDLRARCRTPKNLINRDRRISQLEAESTIEMALPGASEWGILTVSMLYY